MLLTCKQGVYNYKVCKQAPEFRQEPRGARRKALRICGISYILGERTGERAATAPPENSLTLPAFTLPCLAVLLQCQSGPHVANAIPRSNLKHGKENVSSTFTRIIWKRVIPSNQKKVFLVTAASLINFSRTYITDWRPKLRARRVSPHTYGVRAQADTSPAVYEWGGPRKLTSQFEATVFTKTESAASIFHHTIYTTQQRMSHLGL